MGSAGDVRISHKMVDTTYYSIVTSTLSERVKVLVQEVGLLKMQIKGYEARRDLQQEVSTDPELDRAYQRN
jgi:hypothetical protein